MKKLNSLLFPLLISFVVHAQNLALNKPTMASSVEADGLESNLAIDGIFSTRWASESGLDPQWIYVDLQDEYSLDRVVIHWEAAYAIQYQIQLSSDEINWTTVFSETNGNGGEDVIIFSSQSARYVRMYGTQRALNYGYSIYEFEVYKQVSDDDATLSSISINNSPISGFSPQITSYTHILDVGDIEVPTITASTSNPNATFTVNNASDFSEETTILVNSADNTQTLTYSISFQQSTYALVWSDEFENDEITYYSGKINPVDDTKWFHQTYPANGGQGWFNNEEQHYTDRFDNSYVSDGTLKIKAIKETYSNPQTGSSQNYTSARLNSKFAFTYGKVEVRAKLPSELGTWPAIWTLGQNISEQGAYWQTQGYGTTGWPACGEIDIMEQDSNKSITSGAFHFGPDYTQHQYTTDHISVTDTENTWHVYSMIWTDEGISLMVDGVEFHNTSNVDMSFFQANHFILLNVAMGGALGGSIDPNFSSAIMEIDYVRVYQPQPLSTPSIFENELLLYPNPSDGSFQIESGIQIDEVHIYSINGQKLQSLRPNKKAFTIHSNLPKGLYLAEISGSNFREIKRLMIK